VGPRGRTCRARSHRSKLLTKVTPWVAVCKETPALRAHYDAKTAVRFRRLAHLRHAEREPLRKFQDDPISAVLP
jgi:hypothetical protein